MRAICAGLCVAVLGLLLTGCGSSGPAEPVLELVETTGKVTLDGKPLPDAQVTFLFQGSPPKGFIASGATTEADGTFTLQTGSKFGTVVGSYKVIVSKVAAPDGSAIKIDPASGMDLAQLQASGQAQELVPERYSNPESTELEATVKKDGTNDFNFPLTGS